MVQPWVLELGLEPDSVSLPVLEIVLVMALAPEPESARGTVALPPRARACLDHRPPEAQRSSDDQTPRHHPDQRPRIRTTCVFLRLDPATCNRHQCEHRCRVSQASVCHGHMLSLVRSSSGTNILHKLM
jgi:hypothetical protein